MVHAPPADLRVGFVMMPRSSEDICDDSYARVEQLFIGLTAAAGQG
jgi:hypothetical protein